MDWNPLLLPLYIGRYHLLRHLEHWSAEWAVGLRIRLMQIEGADLDQEVDAPVVVALVGGTGVGKSSLFNALIGQTTASPVSHGKRGFTTTVIAAGPREFEAYAKSLPGYEGRFLECSGLPYLLLDMPDLDSVFQRNRETAERTIRQVDILIYVSDPDKHSDFQLLEAIRTWAVQKRWFFVLNKADTLSEEEREPTREDFRSHLVRLGFEVRPDDVWLISTREPQAGELERFTRELRSDVLRQAKATLRVDKVLGQFIAAADLAVTQPQVLDTVLQKLQQSQKQFVEELAEELSRFLGRPHVQGAFQEVVRQYLWSEASRQACCFLKIPFWLRARWAGVRAGWAATALATRGLSVLRLLTFLQGLVGLLREELAVRHLLNSLENALRELLQRQQRDARRLLQKLGLDSPAEPAGDVPPSTSAASSSTSWPDWLSRCDQLLASVLYPDSKDNHMQRLIVGRVLLDQAQQTAHSTVLAAMGRWSVWTGEVLPLFVFLHGLYRVGYSWWFAEWLGLPFLITWSCMLAAAVVPGTWWLMYRLRRQLSQQQLQVDWRRKLHEVNHAPWPELTRTIEELESVRQTLTWLATQASTLRRQLEGQFSPEARRKVGLTGVEPRLAFTAPLDVGTVVPLEPAAVSMSEPSGAIGSADGQSGTAGA